MGSDPPHQPLVLSDIIHGISPTPSNNDEQKSQQHSRSPELLSEDDIIHMKVRLVDMGFSLDAKSSDNVDYANASPKEKELGDMVVKLLDSFIDPSQLLRQAEFIDWLGAQRNLLIQSFQEERGRWEAEREGWSRMAEALLAQRAKAANSPSQNDEEIERHYAVYESENKALRDKLQDSQSRFSALESELHKLKPLLFMQPPPLFATSSGHRLSLSHSEPSMDSSPPKMKQRATDTPVSKGQEQNGARATPQGQARVKDVTSQVQDYLSQAQPRSEYYRKDFHARSPRFSPLHSRPSTQSTPGRTVFSATQTPSTHTVTSKKSKSKHRKSVSHNLLPLTADARTEHLLLAARRIGRERANMVSGLMRRIEKEKEEMMREREADYLERDRPQKGTSSTIGSGNNVYYRKDLLDFGMSPNPTPLSSIPPVPKTPKRTPAGHASTHFLTPTIVTPRSDFHPPTNQTPNPFVFVGAPTLTSCSNSTTSTTARPTSHPASKSHSTPKPTQTPVAPSAATPHGSNHPTPLASLLSAARSMMDDESSESGPSPKVRKRFGALEHPESPIPKRRRGNGGTSKAAATADMLVATPSPGLDRVRSGLDVLADQAAAAFDFDQHSPTKPTTKLLSRAKGKDRVSTSPGTSAPSDMEDDDDLTPKGQPSSARDLHLYMSTGSPVSTRSRSKALLTKKLPKEPTKALHRREEFGDAYQPNPPTPRMVVSPGIRRIASPLVVLPSRTPPRVPPADYTETQQTAIMSVDAVYVDESVGSPTPPDAPAFPRLPSNCGGDRAALGSPLLNMTAPHSPQSQPSAEIPRVVLRGSTEGEPHALTMASSVAGSNQSEFLVCSVPDSNNNQQGEGKTLNEGEGDFNEEDRGQRSRTVSSMSHGTPGTDADAEGEVDIETENDEAAIANSPAARETLSLATSSPRPESSSAALGGMSTKRNSGEQKAIIES